MMKKMVYGVLISLMVVTGAGKAFAETPREAIVKVTNDIGTLLQITRNNNDGINSFDGECNRFVKAQLEYFQVMPYWQSPHYGGKYWCSKVTDGDTTAYGYKIKQIQGRNCLDELLNTYSQPIYNIAISFDGLSANAWGHVCFIHAISNDTVYFTDNWTYSGSNLVAYRPVELDINTFKKYQQESNGAMNALAYFYKNALEEGWDYSKGYSRYLLSTGKYAKNQFVDLGRDEKYYFDSNECMISNQWVKYRGKWYHAAADGHMDLGWNTVDGELYCFEDPSGAMRTNSWGENAGITYYLGDDGKALKNVCSEINGKKWEFDSEGRATAIKKSSQSVGGWTQKNGKRYHEDENGYRDYGWKQLDGEWYYFQQPDGEMKVNGWEKCGRMECYLGENGARLRDTYKIIDGVKYYFDEDGYAEEIVWEANS